MDLLFKDLTYAVIGAAMEVHRTLGPGFLEMAYARALALEFRLRRIEFEQEVPISVEYKGEALGDYKVDFIIAGSVLIEIKALSTLTKAHFAQVYNYLAGTHLQLALLINFGEPSLQYKRFTPVNFRSSPSG